MFLNNDTSVKDNVESRYTYWRIQHLHCHVYILNRIVHNLKYI